MRRSRRLGGSVAVAVLAAVSLLAGAPAAAAEPPAPGWAQRAGGTLDDNASGLAVDAAGNSYVTGKFEGTATWGEGAAARTLTSANGSKDVYVASYSPAGVLRWVVRAGGNGYDEGRDLTVDAAGHVFVVGQFTLSASFGPGPGATTVTAASFCCSDVFVARFGTGAGNVQWVRTAGGSENDVGFGVDLDGYTNVLVTGQFRTTATFGAPGTPRTVTSAGGNDVFVARFGPVDGALAWVSRAGGPNDEYGHSVAVDGRGFPHVVGPFSGSGFWGWGSRLTSAGSTDAFVASWNTSGVLAAARSQGGPGPDTALGIDVDTAGNEFVTGAFAGTATFGTAGSATTRAAVGGFDVWVARYLPSGALGWVVTHGGVGSDLGTVVALDSTGRPVATGQVAGDATFGAGGSAVNTTGAGDMDVFLARHDPATGTLDWATTAGGAAGDYGLGVAAAPGGSLVAAGLYRGPMTFPTSPAPTTLAFGGVADIYLARYP